MPRSRPQYLQRHTNRHGNSVWYFQRGDGPLIRIRGEFGTPEFQDAYEAAKRGEVVKQPSAGAGRSGSLQWLYERYRESEAWAKELSPATRRQRENIFEHVMAAGGSEPFKAFTRKNIEASKDKRRDTPAQARNFLDAMRGLFRWAKVNEHVDVDPTEGVSNPARSSKAPGFPAWTEDDVTSYESKWPEGTKERVWLHVLLYTGLRRGDAVLLGRQHVRNGVATLKTEKTGTEVAIPILPILAKTIAAGPCGDLAFICGDRKQPFTKESFGNVFSAAARAAGVKKSAHGIRKLGATRAAENGATVAELEALFGWEGGAMASLYTRTADRRRLSKSAGPKLAKAEEEVRPATEKAL
jgi:integrase